jgi:pantoate--beta-alanine ligase
MQIIRDNQALHRFRSSLNTLALIPTMGALHAGHLQLVEKAKRGNEPVLVSIFVNPTQFAAHEDLTTYPRDEAGDITKLQTSGADAVWLPQSEAIYGTTPQTIPYASSLTQTLEGEYRPHFFAGVTTVVRYLFAKTQATTAYFGEKDYQQLLVIQEMVEREKINIAIHAVQTEREADGLAKSSRNQYLNKEERKIAPILFQTLHEIATKVVRGHMLETAKSWGYETLLQHGFSDVDYIAIRDAKTLEPLTKFDRSARLLAAAWLGKTRLIDNIAIL